MSDEAENLCLHSSFDTCGDGCIDVKIIKLRVRKWHISGLFRAVE